MTPLANSPVFWSGPLAGLAALYVLPATIAVIRHFEDIPLVVFLKCFPVARLGIAATTGTNIAFGARYGLLGALISAWPAVAFIGSVEIATQQARRARWPLTAASGPAVPEVPGDVEQAVRAAYAASVPAGAPLSQRVMAERFGLSRRRVSQLAAEVTASGNGHRPESGAA
jgi:hypothetical protein